MTHPPDYHQLYLQSKSNVNIFIKQVEQQIFHILNSHQIEKTQLQNQIESLQAQLRHQNQQFSHSRNPSVDSFHPSRGDSRLKESSQLTFDSNAKFTTLQLNSCRSIKNSAQSRQRQRPARSQKENMLPLNLDKENAFKIQSLVKVTRKDKRNRQKKEEGEKTENIKDFLKNMRSKLNSSTCNYAKEAERGPLVSILSPDMFARDRTRGSDCLFY